MAFTAKDVVALREKTGCGMMDCKKALVASDGDMNAAIDFLREKGLAAAEKKSGRAAAEGIVTTYTANGVTAMVEVNCETDFVGKTDEFKAFAEQVAKTVAENKPADLDALLETKISGEELTVAEAVREKVLVIGENIKVRRFAVYEGVVASYIHMGGKIGVMVQFETGANADSDEFVLGQTCIRDNLVLTENGRAHSPKKVTEKWLHKYDLLINSTGVGSLGRTAQIWFEPSKLVVDSHVTIVRAAKPSHALYLGFWAFKHEKFIESLHTGSTGQTELPREHVKAISVVLPDSETLAAFNTIASPSVGLIAANQEENKRLAALRDALLPKLMSGEIDVSEVDLTQLNSHLVQRVQIVSQSAVQPNLPSNLTDHPLVGNTLVSCSKPVLSIVEFRSVLHFMKVLDGLVKLPVEFLRGFLHRIKEDLVLIHPEQ